MPSSETSSLVHAAMPPKSSRHWKRCKRRSPPAASCRYSCSVTRRCRRLCGSFTTILWRSRFTGTSAMPWSRDSDGTFPICQWISLRSCGRCRCCRRTTNKLCGKTWCRTFRRGVRIWTCLGRRAVAAGTFSGIQRNSCSSPIFTTGTVFFSETSWLRCTGLWQRFPFTGTGCGERHCSPPNPWRVEPPLEAGRGDEHEGTDGVEPPKPLRMLVSFCVCGLAVQNMNAFGSLFARYDKWSQTMRGFCGVRPDASRLADAVKMMLEALEQHRVDLNIKEVRDGVV